MIAYLTLWIADSYELMVICILNTRLSPKKVDEYI